MKITKSKLKEMIMQEISGVTTGKSVSRKKVNPKNIKDPARPPKPKGKQSIAPEDPKPEAGILKCWRSGGLWYDGSCTYPNKNSKQSK